MRYRDECNRQPKGENSGRSKLTADQVREIRKLYSEQRKLYPLYKQWQITKPIAKKFGITWQHIGLIINRKSWIDL